MSESKRLIVVVILEYALKVDTSKADFLLVVDRVSVTASRVLHADDLGYSFASTPR